MNQRPISVTIFGILNIGFGLLDLLVTLFSLFILPRLTLGDNPILQQMHGGLWTKITTPLDGIAAVVLLVAGIGLLLGRNWGRVVSIVYSVYAILASVVGGIGTLIHSQSGVMIMVSVFGAMISLTYPILLILFMMKPNIIAVLKPVSAPV